ncbi:MAG: fatty acid desaturase [Alphaproteobacteria bacterium]|nr:fatty acid desaturase [Alphaproteobacteria bacterium]
MEGFVARRDLIPAERLKALSRRCDAQSWGRLGAHLIVLAALGLAVHASRGTWWIAPALGGYGVVLIFLFAPLHESIHRTVFRARWLNDALAWISGLVLVLPPGYFRRFHFAHHRHTQDPRLDPELAGPKPGNLGAYVIYVSGWGYWREAVLVLARHARGKVPEPYIPAIEHPAVVLEARLFCAIYGAIAAGSVVLETLAGGLYWLVPAILGQPALRLFLLAEHTGCPLVPDMLANTRTTRSNALVRGLTWNMPLHTEHHVFPGVPFHALPALHAELAGRHGVLGSGYLAVHRDLVGALRVPAARGVPAP